MKKIYILSDATGQSGLDILKAALVQFENPHIKFTVFPKVESKTKILKILGQAKADNALVAFTLVKKGNRELISEYCIRNNIYHVDILGPLINNISSYLKIEPMENPRLLRKVDERYFKRIEAIEFTVNHDDGQRAQRLEEADIVILGLSGHRRPQHLFFLHNRGSRLPMCRSSPESPYLMRSLRLTSARSHVSSWIRMCSRKCDLPGLATIQPTAVTPTLERYMKRQSTSMPYAGNTNNGR
jgi:regulator of PEP synthase PpsR (kinase-PPPase family)